MADEVIKQTEERIGDGEVSTAAVAAPVVREILTIVGDRYRTL